MHWGRGLTHDTELYITHNIIAHVQTHNRSKEMQTVYITMEIPEARSPHHHINMLP